MMRIEKEYRILEDIDEIRIFNATKSDFYKPSPKAFDVEDIPFPGLIENIPMEIHAFIPYEDGKDFIIQSLGSFTIGRYGVSQDDVKGRLLSELSPLFFDVLKDYLMDVYTSRNPKRMRFVYYRKNKITKINNVKIVFDMGQIFVVSNNFDAVKQDSADKDPKTYDEYKTNMMESFSQTGSYYNINGKYTWSQGIYNIINRPKVESDEYYNIVLDLAIPEDQHIVDKIFTTTNKETSQCEETIRIMTDEGVLKVVEVNIYSYFDDSGIIIRQGLINDITNSIDYENSKPVDFLLDGFKNSKKFSLLIEPLNRKQYEFSKGFYYIIEKDYEEYKHSSEILDNIVEKDVVEEINKLINGEISEINRTLTFFVNGNPNKKKIVDLFIESLEYNNEAHSIGFLTDITEEMEKQEKLIESNQLHLVLIKEIHHRVKNNLQVLNSFLNLEKRAYKNEPDLIIEHMQTRLTSLALLHEKTYATKDFKNIDLKGYMADHDIKTKNVIDFSTELEFETDIDDDLNLTIEVITPLLLIIDEITMNAVKHAFPDKTMPNKKISKKITRIDDNTALLIIKDNGVGIKDPKNISANLGCEIIKSLTKQLGGKITLTEYRNGTEYQLIFPIQMEHTIH